MREQEITVLSRSLDISIVINKFTEPLYNKILLALQQGNFELIGGLNIKEISHLILEIIYCKVNKIQIDVRERFLFWENWIIQHKFLALKDKIEENS